MPQELPCETKILGKRKFRCLTSIFNFSFNHKYNGVTKLITLLSHFSTQIFHSMFLARSIPQNHKNREFCGNSAFSPKPNVHLSL